jgi:hypothetical protein
MYSPERERKNEYGVGAVMKACKDAVGSPVRHSFP